MNGEASNAVFISYRREVGGILAMALHQHLSERGIDAFYDVESLRAGQFDTIILNQIAARPYFLLILTRGTLERCRDPGDWVRREIEQAFATKRVIIPVYTPGFDFDDITDNLPETIGPDLRRYHGQELPQRWFKVAVQQLVDEFLLPIEIESFAPPAAELEVVDRLQREARAAPDVTDVQLSAQEYMERALARDDGDLDARIADLSEAIRLDPEAGHVFGLRGLARAEQGDSAGAIADYDEVIRLDPYDADAFSARGLAHEALGDLDAALADYDMAIRLDPHDADRHLLRGLARWEVDDLDAALEDADEVVRLDPRAAQGYTLRGNVRTGQGDLDGAIADYDRAILLDPDDSGAFLLRGLAYHEQGDVRAAMVNYDEAIRLDVEYASAYSERAGVRGELGDAAGAIADYGEAIRLEPTAELFDSRGDARRELGDLDGAIADFSEAIRLDPANALFYDNRGSARSEQGDPRGAIADHDEAIRLDPHEAALFYNRATARRSQGDLAGAIADAEQGAVLAPEDEDFAELLEELVEELDPGDPELVLHLGNLGLAQEALERHEDARESFQRALAFATRTGVSPDSEMVSVLHMNLGRIFEKLGLEAEAGAEYERGLAIAAGDLGEDHEVSAALRDSLAELRGGA